MPRLDHRKVRTGCQRCKARKVKCNEGRPRCDACTRHDVSCVYEAPGTKPPPGFLHAILKDPSTLEAESLSSSHSSHPDGQEEPTAMLELRLMHHWTLHAARSCSAPEYFQCQIPLVAFDHRHVLDALLALSALHLAKHESSRWSPVDGRMVPIHELELHSISANAPPRGLRNLFDDNRYQQDLREQAYSQLGKDSKRRAGMLATSRMYFDRALKGNRNGIARLDLHNIESCFTCSILIGEYGLFALSESRGGQCGDDTAALEWFSIDRASFVIAHEWLRQAGVSVLTLCGDLHTKPDMTDLDELYHPRHREPFSPLLTFARASEHESDEDVEAYQQTMSLIGTCYRSVTEGAENTTTAMRRILAFSPVCPQQFASLVEQRKPRALLLLGYFFASIKLLEDQVHMLKGIAQRQVAIMNNNIPLKWRFLMDWAIRVANGELQLPRHDPSFDFNNLLRL